MVKRSPGRSRGQGLVEFALIFPVLLMIMYGIIEFGRMMAIYSLASGASRNAVRYGAAAGVNAGGVPYYLDCTGMRDSVRRATVALIGLTDANITIQWDDGTSGSWVSGVICNDASSANQARVASGYRVVVTVSTTYQPILPLLPVPPLPFTFVSARTVIKSISGPTECADGIDNDGDGYADATPLAPATTPDPDCLTTSDNTESSGPGCVTVNVTVTPQAAGTVAVTRLSGSACGTSYHTTGSIVQLGATANPLYTFASWSGGTTGSTNPSGPVVLNTTKEVQAVFNADCSQAKTLTLATMPSTSGYAINPSPAASCPGNGYINNPTVTMVATSPNAYDIFNTWTLDGLIALDNPATYTSSTTLTMNANHTAIASFCGVIAGTISKQGQEIQVTLTNRHSASVEITDLGLIWPPASNLEVTGIQLNNSSVWSGSLSNPQTSPPISLGGSSSTRQIGVGESKTLEIDFAANPSNTASTGYTITAHLDSASANAVCPSGRTVDN